MSADEIQRNIERELFIRSLMQVNTSELRQLLTFCRDVSFPKGSIIYREGTASDYIYFVAAGDVELRAEGKPTWRFSGRCVVGILDALIGRAHSRTTTTTSDVRGVALRTDDYFDVLEDNWRLLQRQLKFVASDLQERFFLLSDPAALFESPGERLILSTDRHELSIVERLLVIRQVRAFSGASTQGLAGLAESCTESQHPAGTLLFEEGDPSDRFWMIARGQIEIVRKTPSVRAIRGPGELIENYAAFGHSTRQYTAKARTEVTMLSIDREDLLDRLEEHFALMKAVFSFLSLELEKVNSASSRESGRQGTEPEPHELLPGTLAQRG